MSVLTGLAVYIIGVWVAYFQIQRWCKKNTSEEYYQMVFLLSTLSWAVYILYGIAWLFKNQKEE